jgi:HAD superfamily hydrolase (TIGR01490 family)
VIGDAPTIRLLDPTASPDRWDQAAFFDLDKTVIARPALAAFTPALYREGYVTKRLLVQAAWTNLLFVRMGATEAEMQRYRERGLAIVKGWDSAEIIRIVRERVPVVIPPIVFPDAQALIDEHRRAGRLTVLISAGPEEVVDPVAEFLGFDAVIASQVDTDENGRYTGEARSLSYGPAKAVAMCAAADDLGLDLERSWAYSDSMTDAPMLGAVGHAVAINPDKALAALARERGWEQRFLTMAPSRLRRATALSPRRVGVAVTLATLVASVWWRRSTRSSRLLALAS